MMAARVYGLIGYPLGHSFSKKYFSEKFEREQMADACFELFPLEHINQFPALLAAHKNLKGLAVTIPYKEKIIPYLDELDESARVVGAVNCIQLHNGLKKGFNTDCIGFEASLRPLLKPGHQQALILGSGGASKAVQYVLHQLGISFQLVRRQAKQPGDLTYDQLTDSIIQAATVIINATPVGMQPNELDCPRIPFNSIGPDHLVYDLIYKPPVTRFLAKAAEQGATVKNGFEMLLIQAEANWQIWNQTS